VSHAELGKLIASADVGLALYRHSDDNMYFLGLSSGKLAEYLRAGVPVVVSDFPGMRELVQRTRCGLVVTSMDALRAAIAAILDDQEGYSERSRMCFDRELAVENFAPDLAAKIRQVITESARRR
jgi:glycosyltransferase involved in cell wall biosynthesis